MENEKVPEVYDTAKLKKLYRYLKIGSVISFVIGTLIIGGPKLKWIGACIDIISTIILILVVPFIDMVNEGFDKNGFLNYFDTFLDIFLTMMICILFYFIYTVPFLGEKSYYSAINKIGIVTAVFSLIRLVTIIIRKIIKEWGSDESKFSIIWINIFCLLIALFSIGLSFSSIYKPETTVYVKIIKTPSKLLVKKVNEHITMDNLSYNRNIGEIENIELINNIISEISNKQYSNIRNFDEINNRYFTEGYPYYEMICVYEDINLADRNLENGYIYMLKVYNNGKVIITDEKFISKFAVSFLPDYRINLSDSARKELLNAIKSLE
jgi:hypothetical protein